MAEQNGKNPKNMENNPSKIFEKPFRDIPINAIKEKLKKHELSIEDILCNNECIEDLKSNPQSKYKKILSTRNIKKLISFCIYPSEPNTIISYSTLRYPYYSNEILCSPCVLQFSSSIESIKKANDIEKKYTDKGENKSEEIEISHSEERHFPEDEKDNIQEEHKEEYRNENDIYDLFSELKEGYEEFMDFEQHQENVSELQKDTMENNNKKSQYNQDDNEVIKEILDKIFGFLDIKFHLDETYVGYFQKLVNYLLINEPKITIEYLFNDNNAIIRKFYTHMNNASMENTFENILNYISDLENKEENLENSRFILIIMELLDEIGCIINKEYDINNNKENYINYIDDKNQIEFISELIINTLINNTEKHLIELVFNSKWNFLQKIIFLIEHSVKLEYKNEINNKKNLIINLLKIVRQINLVIMNSKNLSPKNINKDEINFFQDFYKKIKTFENQYFCKKYIILENIYKAFEENRVTYISSIKKIYELIKNDLIHNPGLNSDNENQKEKEKGKTLMVLNEWKFILSGLKIFIFQFYAIENFAISENIKDFYDEKLFDLSQEIFFKYPKFNLYQYIFIEIIKLLNLEFTPNYLIEFFIQKQNKFIENINTSIKSNDKYNLLIGPSIQILLIFYTSRNPSLIKFYNNEKNAKEKKYRDEFFYLIKPKFERKFDENYEYTEEEIFSDLNDSSDTFDGNDIKNFSKIKFESFKTIVNNYLKRLNLNINNYNHKMSDQSQNQNPNQKETKTEKEEEISEGLTLISTETYLTSQDQDNPGMSHSLSYEIKQQEDSPK